MCSDRKLLLMMCTTGLITSLSTNVGGHKRERQLTIGQKVFMQHMILLISQMGSNKTSDPNWVN